MEFTYFMVRCSGFYTNFKNYKVEKIQLWEGKLNLFHGLTERGVSVIEFLSLTGAIWLMKSGCIRLIWKHVNDYHFPKTDKLGVTCIVVLKISIL